MIPSKIQEKEIKSKIFSDFKCELDSTEVCSKQQSAESCKDASDTRVTCYWCARAGKCSNGRDMYTAIWKKYNCENEITANTTDNQQEEVTISTTESEQKEITVVTTEDKGNEVTENISGYLVKPILSTESHPYSYVVVIIVVTIFIFGVACVFLILMSKTKLFVINR
ncbi:unnamed protein product [Schistosoma turkestanicum]|nr:unnamed protein product [Schistosoma turkestanicum]